MNWTNEALPLIVNASITEYDIKRGNTSIMAEYGLAPAETLAELNKLPKEERNVRVGLLQRDDKIFAKRLEAGFNDAVKRFCEINHLDPEVDILSIKRDAVFVVNKPVDTPAISENVLFRPKNTYHAHLQLGRWEFYFKADGTVDIKNFVQESKDTTGCLPKLQAGPISMIKEFIEVCESTNMDRRKVFEWFKEFCRLYKERKLDPEYYREFSREASYRLDIWGEMTFADILDETLMDENLIIDFNYINLIIPMLKVII